MKAQTRTTIGIDLGDRKHSICVLGSRGQALKEEVIINSSESLNISGVGSEWREIKPAFAQNEEVAESTEMKPTLMNNPWAREYPEAGCSAGNPDFRRNSATKSVLIPRHSGQFFNFKKTAKIQGLILAKD